MLWHSTEPADNFNIRIPFLKLSSDFDFVSCDSCLYSETRRLDCDFYHRGDFLLVVELNLKRGFLVIADIGILQTTAQFCLGFEMQRWRGSSFTFSCTLCCLRVSLFFDCFLIGFSFEFRQFIKAIRICFFGKMLAMFDLAWISLPGSNVKHDWKLWLCLKFLSLWIWFCMCVALVCRCWLWACWDVAKHNK